MTQLDASLEDITICVGIPKALRSPSVKKPVNFCELSCEHLWAQLNVELSLAEILSCVITVSLNPFWKCQGSLCDTP